MYIEITFFAFGVSLTEKLNNIDGHGCLHDTTLNIHLLLMKCTWEFKFDMMMHHHFFKSLVYSMLPFLKSLVYSMLPSDLVIDMGYNAVSPELG